MDINNIRVASPCPVSWDSMHGDDRARRCDQCSLMVYNISHLTNAEVVNLIQRSEKERVCMQLRRRPDGTVITKECPKGSAAYRKRIGVLVGTVFAAMLSFFSAAAAQRSPSNDTKGIRSATSINNSMIEGVVKDPIGAAVPGATIKITNSAGRSMTATTDKRGRFHLSALDLDHGRNTIRVESPGFTTFTDSFSIRMRELIYYPVTLEIGAITGVIVIDDSRSSGIDPRKSETSTTFRVNDR